MTKKKTGSKNQTVIICFAIAAIALIEFALISAGINGAIAMIVVAAIAGLAGYVLPSPLKKPL